MEVRVAVIGAGAIGNEHLRALVESPHALPIAVCDRSSILAEIAADRFQIPHFFHDSDRMFRELELDAVHITTPAASHFDLTRQALEQGCHTFVEKPITTSMGDLSELIRLSKEKERLLLEDHNYLWNPAFREILELQRSGALGDIVHVDIEISLDLMGEGSRFADQNSPHPATKHPLGAASDFLTHMCYLSHALVGSHTAVHASMLRASSRFPQSGCHEYRAMIESDRGTTHLIFSPAIQPDVFRVRVYGTSMKVETNLFETGVINVHGGDGPSPLLPLRNGMASAWQETSRAICSTVRKLSGGPGALTGMWRLIDEFHQAIANESPTPITTEAIQAVNELLHELTERTSIPCGC